MRPHAGVGLRSAFADRGAARGTEVRKTGRDRQRPLRADRRTDAPSGACLAARLRRSPSWEGLSGVVLGTKPQLAIRRGSGTAQPLRTGMASQGLPITPTKLDIVLSLSCGLRPGFKARLAQKSGILFSECFLDAKMCHTGYATKRRRGKLLFSGGGGIAAASWAGDPSNAPICGVYRALPIRACGALGVRCSCLLLFWLSLQKPNFSRWPA